MSRVAQRDLGDFPTPAHIASVLARETLTPLLPLPDAPRVLDPACGEGALLLAAGAFLDRRGRWAEPGAMVGVDVHPGRARAARQALRASVSGQVRIVCADALSRPSPLRDGAFDAVIANPPFLSPTAARGALSAAARRAVKERLGDQVAALTNIASVFLADALRLTRPGGMVGMILPQTFLTSRDSTGIRADALRQGTLEWLWTDGDGVFDASVTVCGVVIRRQGRARPTIRRAGGRAASRRPAERFDVAGHAMGEPWRPGDGAVPKGAHSMTVGDLATPITGFRRHFYAVADALSDNRDGEGRPAVTAGLIDPGRILWGRVPARIAGRRWDFPRVDPDAVIATGTVTPWLMATHVPKVLVATQTRVVECAVDADGEAIPAVPVIALAAPPEHLWHIAAALTSPFISRLAFQRHSGAALSPDAIKMSGSEIAALPLPHRGEAWDIGAEAMQAAACAGDAERWRTALDDLAAAMDRAYGVRRPTATRTWWAARLPPFRGGDAGG